MKNETVRRYYSFNVCTEMKKPNISDERQSKYSNFCGLSPIMHSGNLDVVLKEISYDDTPLNAGNGNPLSYGRGLTWG